jgi:hypothetical protein
VKFLLIKAMAEAHGYSHFVNSIALALSELGHETVISDQSQHVVNGAAPAINVARDVQAARCDVVLSFSSFFGAVQLDDGRPLFDALGVKFVGWQVDHPIYAPQSLARSLQNRLSIYANHNHTRFAQAIKVPGKSLPMLLGAEPPDLPLTAYKAREWPVLVAATWNGVPQRPWDAAPDTPARRLLVGVIDRLLAHREASLLDAFNATVAQLGLSAQLGTSPAFDDQMISFLRDPLTYVRHVDRIELITRLADAGFPLCICGAGWRDYLGERGNVTYVDRRVDFKDIAGLYNNAKIVINLNAGNGACERAIYGAMAGAAVVSDYSEQLSAFFEGSDGLASYNRAKPGHVVEAVGRLLESDRGEAMAERGHRRAMERGHWRHRAQQLVDFVAAD